MLPRRTLRHHKLAILATICASMLTCACEGPEKSTVDPFAYPDSDGSKYTVNLHMLSEWGGQIISENDHFTIKKTDDGYKFNDDDVSNFIKEVKSEDGKVSSISLLASSTLDGNGNQNVFVDCSNSDKKDVYICHYAKPGFTKLYNTWLDIREDSNSIRLGNGDEFGVSHPASKVFDDIPAIQALNKLNLTADALGNHNFDNGIAYLANLISLANFPFLVTNLYNIPNNFESNVTPYKIVDIPDDHDPGATPLHVALVAALDPEVADKVSRGSFGTLSVKDYCPVINAMEESYNHGARAFILLPHLANDQNMKHLLATLYGMIDQVPSECEPATEDINNKTDDTQNNKTDDNKEEEQKNTREYTYHCQSKLVITETDLKKVNKTRAKLEEEIKRYIFNSILLIYGPNSDEPILHSYNNDTLKYICINNDKDEFQKNEIKKSIIKLQNSPFNIYQDNGVLLENLTSLDKDYDLTLAEIPNGHVATASFEISKTESGDGLPPYYTTHFKTYKVETLYAPQHDENHKTYVDCRGYLKGLFGNNQDADKHPCMEYFEAQATHSSLTPNHEKAPIDFSKCYSQISENDELLAKKNSDFEEFWRCMYNSYSHKKSDNSPDWNNVICQFIPDDTSSTLYDINPETKKERRSEDTLISNLFTTAIQEYIRDTLHIKSDSNCSIHEKECDEEECRSNDKKQEPEQCIQLRQNFRRAGGVPDAVVINAGTILESGSMFDITTSSLVRLLPLDYNNTLKMANLTINGFVKLLEQGLEQKGNGGFPIVSGIYYSYEEDKTSEGKSERHIVDIVKVDANGKLEKIYVHNRNSNFKDDYPSNCILGVTNKNSDDCYFGEYTESNETVARINPNYSSDGGDTINIVMDDPTQMIRVLVTDYMAGGGDKYNFKVLNAIKTENQSPSQTQNEDNSTQYMDLKNVFPFQDYRNADGSKVPLRDMIFEFFEKHTHQNGACVISLTHKDSSEMINMGVQNRIFCHSFEANKPYTPPSVSISTQEDLHN